MRDAPGHDPRSRQAREEPDGKPELPRYGSYRIVGALGRGGVGAVYVGEHVLIGKRVAIKVLLPELSRSREVVARFFHEARSAASIQDPGIVEVFDFGYDGDGNAYIAMELLHGENLAARLAARPRPSLAFLSYVGRQIARSVGAAHAQHIVHRDLKPDNVFLADDPDLPFSARVKVLDFGMAKLTGEGPRTVITEKGALLGTPMYMAPEQCRGLSDIDGRADVYALGCMLYEMACGHPPFVSGGVGLILGSHIYEPVPRPRALVPELPEALEVILLRCLEKDPAARYPTMDELSRDLAQLAEAHGRAPRAAL
ncbi:MAG: serine/threonine-protein kinase [Polyangiales bacterium]